MFESTDTIKALVKKQSSKCVVVNVPPNHKLRTSICNDICSRREARKVLMTGEVGESWFYLKGMTKKTYSCRIVVVPI